MDNHEIYMHHCLELAKLGAGTVAPNPMVGAVVVYQGKIIGEGYHEQFGKQHAEVNCIESVKHKHLIEQSTLYVSLEPCAHFGKTPPCVDLILQHQIKKVVVGSVDPFAQVDGKGIEKLKTAGVEVVTGVLKNQCTELNKRFFTFHTKQRPYIILKWAQSANQKIAKADKSRVHISNDFTNRLVHKWRSEEQAIMVGTTTAMVDDPALNVRLWNGKNPVRLVLDLDLKLPSTLKVLTTQQETVVFNLFKQQEEKNLLFYKIEKKDEVIKQILAACYKLNIQSVLVEGGSRLLQTFIDKNLWDEARVIQNNELIISGGLNAPELKNQTVTTTENLFSDMIFFYKNIAL